MISHSSPLIEQADREAVLARLEEGMLAEGEEVARLERELAGRTGARDAVAVGSGSQALRLALEAVGAGTGTTVVVPTYVCLDVLAAVEATGAEAVITDVRSDYGLDPDRAEEAIDSRTAAVLAVHPFGRRTDPGRLRDLGPPVVEDRAHRFPCSREGSRGGQTAVFSFHATKMLAGGEGGAVVTWEDEVARRVRARKQFRDTPYRRNFYPLSDLQAALVRSQMNRTAALLERRRELASRFARAVRGWPEVEPAFAAAEEDHHFFRFPLRVEREVDDGLLAEFEERGVAARRPVDRLLHQMPGTRRPASCPTAETLYRTTLSLPFYPALTEAERERVIEVAGRLLG